MKNSIPLLFIGIIGWFPIFSQQNERCGALHGQSQGSFAWPLHAQKTIERAVVEIPIVVHVIWNTDEENISDEQIFSQIAVLNQDFNAENMEVDDVPNIFKPLVADIDFNFCLATQDANGDTSNGITRTHTANNIGIGGTSALHYTDQGGEDAWDTEKYLNIWVAKFAGGLGGVASFPGEGPQDEQGVEINFKQFGTMGTAINPPYHLGRTCTHEIGHYFNLEHIWGPNFNSCCGEDDGVADTPDSCEDYLNECPSGNTFSCTAPDMWMNFMNYTDDACMAMFSKGQKERIYAALNDSRPGLLHSNGCSSVGTKELNSLNSLVIFGNPIHDELRFEIKANSNQDWKLQLTNALGQTVYFDDKEPNTQLALNCEALPSGLYFLSVSQNQIHLTKRFVRL